MSWKTMGIALIAAAAVGFVLLKAFGMKSIEYSPEPDPVAVSETQSTGNAEHWVDDVLALKDLPSEIQTYLTQVNEARESDPNDLGYTFVKGSYQRANCETITAPVKSGGNILQESCDVVLQFEEPYGSMSLAGLKALGELDPQAAFVVGLTLANVHAEPSIEDYRESARFLMQSFALSTHPDAFHALLAIGGSSSLTYTNGELDVRQARSGLALMLAAEPLGVVSDSHIQQFTQALTDAGVAMEEVHALRDRVVASINSRRLAAGMEELL